MSQPYVGQIMQAGFNFAPRGWALCQAQILGIAQNQALFALLGTTFGGNGSTNFQLPDARGKSFIGWGQAPGFQNYVLGELGGNENTTILTQNMPPHNHSATFTGTGGTTSASGTLQALTGTTPANSQTQVPGIGSRLANTVDIGGGGTPQIYAPSSSTGTAVNLGGLTVQGGPFTPQGTVQTALTGNGLPINNMQPFQVVTTCIALVGIFPSRN